LKRNNFLFYVHLLKVLQFQQLVFSSSSYIRFSAAKILSQVASSKPPLPVQIHAQAKNKDPPTDALINFLKSYKSRKRIGTLLKDKHTGKMVDEWNKALDDSAEKPELVDMAQAVSTLMAVKDDEELVSDSSSFLLSTKVKLICRA
jgi:nucleosome binding factor SPN SPT16 subunit